MKEKHIICYPLHSHGKFIKVKGVTMCVSVEGTGDEVIVLLSGIASPSPIIEMQALSSFLINKYTVVVLEYLGYGLSDSPKTERTVENISDEIHDALKNLGFPKYSIVAHSISGAYILYYTNKYLNEIDAVIGIDSSVPKQADNKKITDRIIACAERDYVRSNSKLQWWITDFTARKRLQSSNEYIYSKRDIKDYGLLAALMLSSEDILNEYKNIPQNFNRVRNIKFPLHIRILFILSAENTRQNNEWYKLHEQFLGENKGKIISIKGGNYLHLKRPARIAKEIDDFLSEKI